MCLPCTKVSLITVCHPNMRDTTVVKASRLDCRAVRVQGHSFVPMTTWGFLVDLRSAMSSSITGTLDMEVHAYTEYYTTCGL